MLWATLVVDNIGKLVTMDGSGPHGLGIVDDAVVVVDGGTIAWAGPRAALPEGAQAALAGKAGVKRIDARGRCVVPGLIDCHTHLVFAGDRADEFARRARGESYQQIMAAGGGIRSTMRAVRAASVGDLVDATRPRLARMLASGVTTVEVKSGYGLDVENELKMLYANRELAALQPVDIVSTLLAAHAIPPEFDLTAPAQLPASRGSAPSNAVDERDEGDEGDEGDARGSRVDGSASAAPLQPGNSPGPAGYIELIVRELLPIVIREKLATSCDVFVEGGAFSVDDGRRLLRAAKDAGLAVRVHAEQLSHAGGALLAAEVGAMSAGHLEHVDDRDIAALAKAGVVCEVLSLAQVFLRGQRAIPGRALVDGGCTVAVATDCNPGTAMSGDVALAAGLSVSQSGLTAEEALKGITVNAARALGLADRGVIAAGKRADLVVLTGTSPFDLVYRWAEPHAHRVVAHGREVYVEGEA